MQVYERNSYVTRSNDDLNQRESSCASTMGSCQSDENTIDMKCELSWVLLNEVENGDDKSHSLESKFLDYRNLHNYYLDPSDNGCAQLELAGSCAPIPDDIKATTT